MGIFALALLATAGYGVQKSMKSNVNLSGLALSNVEALAQNEGGTTIDCSTDYQGPYCGTFVQNNGTVFKFYYK